MSFDKLKSLEDQHPILALRLHKMLLHLMARKEEIAVDHLSTLHTILNTPAHKPVSRSALKALSRP